jgi:hypothetical protein
MWVDRITTTCSPILASRFRIEAGGRLVDDHQARRAEQRLGDAEALAHAARIGAECALARVPEIGLLQQRFDRFLALALAGQPLEDGEVAQQPFGTHLLVDAEVLGQVAELAAQPFLVLQDVEAVEMDASAIGILQRGDGAHQRGLAGAVRPQQPEHSVGDVEADIVDGLDAIGIGLVELLDR